MHIYIQNIDSKKNSWTGTITPQDKSASPWTFELIRQTTIRDIYNTHAFDANKHINGLLDFQKECCIIRPLVKITDPWTFGVSISALRTKISGIFHALLIGTHLTDFNDKIFTSISYTSETFTTWYAAPTYRFSNESSNTTISCCDEDLIVEEHHIGEAFLIKCSSSFATSQKLRSTTLTSSAKFSLEFFQPQDIDSIIDACCSIDIIFSFLTGFSCKPQKFSITTINNKDSQPKECELKIGGRHWQDIDNLHPLNCLHINRREETTAQSIFERYSSDRKRLSYIMHAIEYCLQFTNNVVQRFSTIVPIAEEYFRAKYTQRDERNFINNQKQFSEYIDSSGSTEIIEFYKKHVQIKETKKPSFTTILRRAVSAINDYGFSFKKEIPTAISRMRGRTFHSRPAIQGEDALDFYNTTNDLIHILKLHIMIELGINIAYISKNPHLLR